MSHSLIIAGEKLDTLLLLFRYLEKTKERDGTIGITARNVPMEVMTPFLRALMRRESRLLQEDADNMGDDGWEPRNQEQRRVDAFVDLVVSIAAARKYVQGNQRIDSQTNSPRRHNDRLDM